MESRAIVGIGAGWGIPASKSAGDYTLRDRKFTIRVGKTLDGMVTRGARLSRGIREVRVEVEETTQKILLAEVAPAELTTKRAAIIMTPKKIDFLSHFSPLLMKWE